LAATVEHVKQGNPEVLFYDRVLSNQKDTVTLDAVEGKVAVAAGLAAASDPRLRHSAAERQGTY